MAWRPVAGGILGFLLWWVLFYSLGIGIGLLWPEYREAARVMFLERQFRLFTPPMLLTNLLVFTVAGIVVGWAATRVARSRTPALVLTALFLVYAVVEHYVLLWNKLPAWYNLIVPAVLAGCILLGSRIVSRRKPDVRFGIGNLSGR